MASDKKEIYVGGDDVKEEVDVSELSNSDVIVKGEVSTDIIVKDEVFSDVSMSSTNFGPIRRKRQNGLKNVECKICMKTMRSDTLKRHMKRKDHNGLTGTASKKVTHPLPINKEDVIDGLLRENERYLEIGKIVYDLLENSEITIGGLNRENKRALAIYNENTEHEYQNFPDCDDIM